MLVIVVLIPLHVVVKVTVETTRIAIVPLVTRAYALLCVPVKTQTIAMVWSVSCAYAAILLMMSLAALTLVDLTPAGLAVAFMSQAVP